MSRHATTVVSLGTADAGRLLARYHLQQGALPAVLDRLGTIQFDPLAPMGTNPDLVLQARVPDYCLGGWQVAAYRERRLVDGWDKQASLIQSQDWWAQGPMQRWFAQRWLKRGVDVQGAEAREILREVESKGPATSLELGDQRADPRLRGSWYGSKRSRHVLRALWDAGLLVTHHRVAGRHAYDLPERVLPAQTPLLRAATTADALARMIFRRVQAVGLLRPAADQAVWLLPCSRRERDCIAARLIEQGLLLNVDVAGERYWATPEALACLDVPWHDAVMPLRFLAPLDPLVWDRTALARLFGFDYVWEVYKPVPLRRWGYYVLPVIWGERLVARFDGRCQGGVLQIHAWYWQQDIDPRALPAGLAEALEQAAAGFLRYLAAGRVQLPKGLGRTARSAWQRAARVPGEVARAAASQQRP